MSADMPEARGTASREHSLPSATFSMFISCTGGSLMTTIVFVEPRPKGKPEGTPINDYVVEDQADHALAAFQTQEAAIHWARTQGHIAHVARVRHLNDKSKPDHWRKV